jgi:flagellar basal body-associated protein FliL
MIFPVMLIGLLIIGLLVAGVVTLVVVLTTRNKQPVSPQTAPQPAAPVTLEDRQAILKQLADGELTKAQAEEQLARLGSPVPETMPVPPPSGSGTSKGCLIAALIALILPIVLLVLVFLFFVSVRVVHHPSPVQIEPTTMVYPEAE